MRIATGLGGFALVAVLLVGSSARGDGLLYQLPPDGSWVRFRAAMTHDAGGAAGEPGKMNATFTMRSVGSETVEGEKCRWIEMELVPTNPPDAQQGAPGGPPHVVCKLLLPEKNLQKGKDPLDHIVKGWLKFGDQEPQEMKDAHSEQAGPVPAFLSGPLDDVKQLDKKTIDTKLGKLECAGLTARKDYAQGDAKTNVKFETRLHDKAPFGVVSSTLHYQTTRARGPEGGTLALDFDDAGKDAKSAIPMSQ